MNWNDFFHMGGYAFYVWGSFGVTAALLVAEVLFVRARKHRALMLVENEREHSGGAR
jgi:heme exporter protein D